MMRYSSLAPFTKSAGELRKKCEKTVNSQMFVENLKYMCYITNRTKKIVSPGRKVGILSYSELCTCDFANVALNKSYL